MAFEQRQLHLFFFPLPAPGHNLPMVDMAKLFARRGVRSSLLITPAQAPAISASLRRASEAGHPVGILQIELPRADATGLPETLADIKSADDQMDFLVSTDRYRDSFERLLREHRPDAVVTDMFYPWSVEVAEDFGVPCLMFHGTSFLGLCVRDALMSHHRLRESSDRDENKRFVVPGLPRRIEFNCDELPDMAKQKPEFVEVFVKMKQSEKRCFGVVVNSFYELEPEFADHYRKTVGMKAWHIGPVSLCNEDDVDKVGRGREVDASVDSNDCLRWLADKDSGSVVYVCFGSACRFTSAQLREIALGLEASGHPFIWVVRTQGGQGVVAWEQWLPDGFEERTAGRGMIIRGWAPQIILLNHEGVGAFVTHCGWNSCLEGITAGIPMVAWPLFADQFGNEKHLVHILGVAVSIGDRVRYTLNEQERPLVRASAVASAVKAVMGDGSREMRRRARELKEAARSAVREGGSSHCDVGRLIEELQAKQITVPCNGDAGA